jgi:hypothetical protein
MSFMVFKMMILFTQISEYFLVGLLVLFLGGIILVFYRKYKRNKLAKANMEKKWLFKEIIDSFGYSLGLINLPIQLLLQLDNVMLASTLLIALLSFLIVFFSLFYYVILFVIPSHVEQYLLETYPEYKFVQ